MGQNNHRLVSLFGGVYHVDALPGRLHTHDNSDQRLPDIPIR